MKIKPVKHEKCSHIFSDNTKCNRFTYKLDSSFESPKYCIYHAPHDDSNRVSDNNYLDYLQRLIRKQDSNWRGFIFPKDLTMRNIEIPITIDARESNFQNVSLKEVTFELGVNVSDSLFLDTCTIAICKSKYLTISDSTFQGTCHLTHIKINENLIARNCKFEGPFKISGTINKVADFASCSFAKKVEFIAQKAHSVTLQSGSISVTCGNVKVSVDSPPHQETFFTKLKNMLSILITKIKNKIINLVKIAYKKVKKLLTSIKQHSKNIFSYWRQKFPHKRTDTIKHTLFKGKANLTDITFQMPSSVIFKGIDLRQASFSGTDLRDVSFIGNNWYQKKLNRNGLYEDVWCRSINNYYDKKDYLPSVENAYRNIRYAMENNRDYSAANDFFIGEMDAKRQQKIWYKKYIFSVEQLYRMVSKYGTSPKRSFSWVLALVISHSVVINLQKPKPHETKWEIFKEALLSFNWSNEHTFDSIFKILDSFIKLPMDHFSHESIIYSLQTITLQKNKISLHIENEIWISYANLSLSIIGPVMLAILALSLRTSIKRH